MFFIILNHKKLHRFSRASQKNDFFFHIKLLFKTKFSPRVSPTIFFKIKLVFDPPSDIKVQPILRKSKYTCVHFWK